MNIVLFDGFEWKNLHPLTLTKPMGELRMGILTFRERWEKFIRGHYSYLTENYLSEKFPAKIENLNLFINPAYLPFPDLVQAILKLKDGEALMHKENLIAGKLSLEDFRNLNKITSKQNYTGKINYINRLWSLFGQNDAMIQLDFELVTNGRKSQPISHTNGILNPANIFIEEGAMVEFSVLNAHTGPIYIGKDAEVMEGSLVRGSLAVCEGAKLNMGTKIYSGTTIGPYCKVGGEVNNSILMGYSNKGHEGFLGNSVLGEWCNLGADTNNSNLKNNYSTIKVWDYVTNSYIESGLQFCGLMMGDFSKSAINTQFNTGTVTGVSANVFEPGFPPKFIPSFSWGGKESSPKYDFEKSCEAAQKMMERRKKLLTEVDKRILKHIYLEPSEY